MCMSRNLIYVFSKYLSKEASRIKEALKKPEFRKLLVEYAEEISDPENKKVRER